MLSTHRSVTAPVESRNPMYGGNGQKEGRKGREIKNRGKEWTNWKEHGGFGDSW